MKIQVTDHPTCPLPLSLMPQSHSGRWGKPRQGRRQAWPHIPSLEFGVPARRKYRSQLSSAKQVTGTQESPPAPVGLTSRTHSSNKHLLSACLCKALPERRGGVCGGHRLLGPGVDGPHPSLLPLPRWALPYAQGAQPHLVGFSTSAAKEVPSLHSKVTFLRFCCSPWQQPGPGHEPPHCTQDSGRVVRQTA